MRLQISVNLNTNVVGWVDVLLEKAVQASASDIHIEPLEECVRIRFRIHGILWEMMRIEKKFAEAISIRIKALARMNIAEKRLPQDGSYRYFSSASNKYIDLRISVVPVLHGEKVVLRLLGGALVTTDMIDLGMTTKQAMLFRRHLFLPYGLIVSGGATGTGKSTTLYAGLQEINNEERNIVAVEDPVEYRVSGINQVNIDEKIGMSFSIWLRSILRQDPDVIMIGEIRDKETAEIAIRAALTGHLVLSTLHVNRATDIPLRFLEMGIAPYLLNASLRLAMAQRLVRVLCPCCKRLVEGKRMIDSYVVTNPYEAVGCDSCHGIGYVGRVGVFELLSIDSELRNSLVYDGGVRTFAQLAKKRCEGTLEEEVLKRAQNGEVDWRDAAHVYSEVQ